MVSKRERINGVVYTHGELKTLYYLANVDMVELGNIAAYCGIQKPTAHSYISALIRKGLADQDGGSSNVPMYYSCTDKVKAQTILDEVPAGIIDPDTPFPLSETKESHTANKLRIDDAGLSLSEVQVLKCVLEAPDPVTPADIAKESGKSLSYAYANLRTLLAKRLLDRKRIMNREYCYWCKEPESVRAILSRADEAWPGWRR